jgi:hypothetical protein
MEDLQKYHCQGVSNKFRRTETGCAQDEKEIVDFN